MLSGNEQQLQAINSNHRTILVLAAAGAGKTFCLINRINRLVQSGVNPRSILALTFTNAAAFEMGERFKKLNNSSIQPEFRTFHGFAYSVVVKEPKVREVLGYSKVPEICEDSEMKRIKTDVRLRLGIKMSQDILDAGRVSVMSLKEKHEFELYTKALRKYLITENLITFDMLNSEIAELFASKSPAVERFRMQYKHILCDEFQDTDDTQMKFLNSFPNDVNFFMVGDALQNIYGFRNCTNKYVKLLSTDSNWEHIKLFKNYRSTRQICEFANRMSTYADASYRIEMEGQRDGDDVKVYYGASADYVDLVDSKHVKKVIELIKASDDDGAVLCRTNKEVQYMCDSLKTAGLDYSTNNKTNDDLELLECVGDNEYMMNWLSTFLDNTRYADYIRSAAQQHTPDIRWFLTTYGDNAKIKPRATAVINIRKIMTGPETIVDKCTKISKLLKTKLKEPDLSGVQDNATLLAYLKEHVQDVQEHKLYVGTIHSSKGLEYGSVYLMGVNDRSFPIDSEEMKNLYYVGLTRAKNHLYVFRG